PAGLVQAAVRAARRDTVTPDEDRELLYGGLDFEGWCAQDVGTLIRAHAQRPRVPWIFKILRSPARHDVEYVTWRQLMERAGGYARRYRELGLRDGAVVMLVLPQGIELIAAFVGALLRSEEHTSELQSRENLVCRLLLEKKNKTSTSQ